ncbi:MAG: arsenate reductase ArsC [Deltaproteobacteria bacterium]|nr:arsenate reductase ArsC [Deltaproteobacteria bacterium]
MNKLKILFLCTGNSCRSQMAEGWACHLKGDVITPFSAGITAHGLNPLAVRVMAEAGVDISAQESKTVDRMVSLALDVVVTVCGHAHEVCPVFPAKTRVVHVGFEDPPFLARGLQDEQSVLDCYRRVRDEIREFIQTLPQGLGGG